MSYFQDNLQIYKLKIPEYETPVFGHKVGELRIVDKDDRVIPAGDIRALKHLESLMFKEDMKFCTFRGDEELNVVRSLQDAGFVFVSSYADVMCNRADFRGLEVVREFGFSQAAREDFTEILDVEYKVFDYSSFQVDPNIDPEKAKQRNCKRVESSFNKSGHVIYCLRVKQKIVGFLQFVLDEKRKEAVCANGAIHPDYQGYSLGAILYSKSFSEVFSLGYEVIKSGYSFQNKAMANIFSSMNFVLSRSEIHLRKY
ncbi:MAG: hypothetical protein HN757_18545, partial [Calditrichaeota bacterium]|nr:hypothetical protein [Calditrichota bacterium]